MRRRSLIVMAVTAMVMSAATAALGFGRFGDWSPAEDIEDFSPGADDEFNTAAAEGCPFVSPDGKMFFIASNRADGEGGLDIWVSTREHTDEPWGEPQNLGPPINTEFNDFCPTIGRDGHTFFFVSTRPGHCGDTPNADIYTTRFDHELGTKSVTHLGCEVNSAWDEHSPFPARIPGEGPVLFYSSARPAAQGDDPGDHDIYRSTSRGGNYRAGEAVAELNTAFNDGQPNVRRDGRELFFWSDRPGGEGGPDIMSASRESAHHAWSEPVHLGPDVNSPAGETRPSLSWDGTTLYFGSTRVGAQSDIYVTTR